MKEEGGGGKEGADLHFDKDKHIGCICVVVLREAVEDRPA